MKTQRKWNDLFPRIEKAGTQHLYAVGVETDTEIGTVEVDANNRDQAARIAERAGFVVRDVNMVG